MHSWKSRFGRAVLTTISDMKYVEVKFTLQPYSQTAADLLSAMLADAGFEAFAPADSGLLGYVQQQQWDEEAVQALLCDFVMPGVEIGYTSAEAPDEDWNSVWEEEGFQPIIIPQAFPVPSIGGGTHTVPSPFIPPLEGTGEVAEIVVHDVRHKDVPSARYDILITPRMAFGTGSHQTTRLILRTLARLDLAGRHVVDAGTGTGILAIMAAKRGAAHVLAYDIDDWSVENTHDNLLLNHIYNNVVEVQSGDSAVLKGREQADLLIANINLGILLADLPRFAKAVKPGGKMLLSGFYLSDVPTLTDAAGRCGFSLRETQSEEEWAMLLFEADASGRRDA